MSGRRLLTLLLALAAIGIPAGVLQAVCAGRSCDEAPGEGAKVPFCELPEALRVSVANGYREDRSPDVLAVAAGPAIVSETGGTGLRAPWPSTAAPDTSVPIVFAGAGITRGAPVADATTLDRIAPTVAEALGFARPFPDVRSGTAIDGVASEGAPRLVLLIGLKGIGTREQLEGPGGEWPFLSSLLDAGAGTLDGDTGSLPLDPAAALATIGTGGPPSQHGVIGSLVRSDEGEVTPAFGEGAPVYVISTLADDLEDRDAKTLVGLVATDASDRGLVGGGWYEGQDPVDVVIGDSAAAPLAVDVLLGAGFGDDAVVDVLGVVLEGPAPRLDRLVRRIVGSARAATDEDVLVVVAGTGSVAAGRAVTDRRLVRLVERAVPGDEPVVAAATPGGLFLDQRVLRRAGVTGQVAVDALLAGRDPDGRPLLADAFQGYAVSFARYC